MTTPTRVTVEEFLAMEETKPYLELINGEVVPKAMPGPKHSRTVFELARLIGNYLEEHPVAFGDTELRHRARSEDWVFLPDISVTLWERLSGDEQGAVEVMPDLAIEVLSPDDRPGRVAERIDFYIRVGTSLIWVIDPELENVTVYRPGAALEFQRLAGTLDAEPLLPGSRWILKPLRKSRGGERPLKA